MFFVLVIFVVLFVFGIVIVMAGFGPAAIGIVVGVLILALIVPTIAVWVRRCHDAGRSTGEAVLIFVLVNVASLATPVGGGFVEVSWTVQTLAWVVFGLAALYTFYLATKKGGEVGASLRGSGDGS